MMYAGVGVSMPEVASVNLQLVGTFKIRLPMNTCVCLNALIFCLDFRVINVADHYGDTQHIYSALMWRNVDLRVLWIHTI